MVRTRRRDGAGRHARHLRDRSGLHGVDHGEFPVGDLLDGLVVHEEVDPPQVAVVAVDGQHHRLMMWVYGFGSHGSLVERLGHGPQD